MSDLTERAQRLLDAATPGPWSLRDPANFWSGITSEQANIIGVMHDGGRQTQTQGSAEGDAEFIAAAPSLVADLLAELERRDRRDALICDDVRRADAAITFEDQLPGEWNLSVRFIFRWYDLWVGAFVDRPNHRVYLFPIPCFGVVITRSHDDRPR